MIAFQLRGNEIWNRSRRKTFRIAALCVATTGPPRNPQSGTDRRDLPGPVTDLLPARPFPAANGSRYNAVGDDNNLRDA
jgi:hypothetical protein